MFLSTTEITLALLPVYPLISFLLLISLGERLSWRAASIVSVGAMALSAISSFVVINQLSIVSPILTVHLWNWFELNLAGNASTQINISFYLDGLAAVMISVVTGVGLLIHVFAAAYMKSDENFTRFMAYMNLFIVAMLYCFEPSISLPLGC